MPTRRELRSRLARETVLMVEQRAAYRCEYCRKSLRDEIGEIDHIWPASRGGDDSPSNLALLCARCNRNKGYQISHEDPISHLEVPLFNPRSDAWEEHFRFANGQVRGESVVARATATLLFRATPRYFPPDLGWRWAQAIHNETTYAFLNRLRALRLANDFRTLDSSLANQSLVARITNEDERRANFALSLLKIEVHFTRSRYSDLSAGITAVSEANARLAVTREERVQLLGMRTTLLGQKATALALRGYHSQAREIQLEAARLFRIAHDLKDWRPSLVRIRYLTIARKHHSPEHIAYGMEDLVFASEKATEGDLRPLMYLADAELRSGRPSRYFDKLLAEIDEAVQHSGYGQDFDYAMPVPLRRRWWALSMLAGVPVDSELLSADLKFWKRIRMYNELRELRCLFEEIARGKRALQGIDHIGILGSIGKKG